MSLKRRNARTVECSPPIDLDNPPSTCADLTIWFNELTLALHHGVAQWPECPRVKSLQQILNAWGRVRTPAGNVENVLKARRIRESTDYDVSSSEPPDDPMVLPLWHAIGLGRMAHDVATAESIDSAAARSVAASVRIAVAGVATRETAETDAFKRHHGIKDAGRMVRQAEDEVAPGPGEIAAQNDLLAYGLYCTPGFRIAPHHRVIADALMRVVRGATKRLIISLPPRSGKSFIVSQHFPAYYLGHHPGRKVMAFSVTADLAGDFGVKTRNLIGSAEHTRVFPACTLAEGDGGKTQFRTSEGGEYFALGIGTVASGRGAHVGIIDDAYNDPAQVASETYRRTLREWYAATFRTRIMPGGAVVVMHTRWQCILPGCTVMTPKGIKRIEALDVQDRVLTSKGMQDVQAIAQSHHDGDVFKIRTYGYKWPLKCTPDHRILTEAGWKEAKDVSLSDWLVYPVDRTVTPTEYILCRFPPDPDVMPSKYVQHKRKRVGSKHFDKVSATKRKRGSEQVESRVPRAKLAKLLDRGLTYEQIAPHFGLKTRRDVWWYVVRHGLRQPRAIAFSSNPLMDPGFWRVVGYWIAEGIITGGRKGSDGVVRFCFGSHETHLVEDIRAVMKPYGIPVRAYKRGSSLIGHLSSKQMAAFLSRHFLRGAHNKRLPEWVVNLPIDLAREMVRGYIDGDGCVCDRWARGSSVSRSLLEGFRAILIKMGVPASVMVAGDGKSKEIEIAGKKAVSTGKALELRFALSDAPWMTTAGKAKGMNPPKVKARGHRFSNGNYLVRVKSIAKESYSGPVYDIQTPSHDFVCQGVTVHNCDDLAGWLLDEHKRDGWEVISIPAIAEDDELWITSEGPWGRKKGEPLDPEWWREEMDDLLKYGKWKPQTTPSGQDPIKEYATFYYAQLAQTLGSRFFSALYQQRPTPGEGGKCKLGWFKRYKHAPACKKITLSIDTGQKDKVENDPSVIMVWGEFDGGHAVLEVWRERVIYPRLVPKVIEYIKSWNPLAVLIEDKASGISLLQDLGCTQLANHVPIIGVNPDGNKEVRFDRITPLIESGRVWIPETDSPTPWLSAFEEEVTQFPLAKHDDQIDALSQYLNWVRKEGMAFAGSGQESFSDPAMTALLGRISGPWSKGGALAGAVGNGSLVFRRR